MPELDSTLANLAPGVTICRELDGFYNPRHGLAIYYLPTTDYSPSAPGMVLGEALAARSGLGCTLLEGIPEKIPSGAVVIAQYNDLKAVRPDLVEDVPPMCEKGQYAIRLKRHALITSLSGEGLAAGMQTLAMIVLRHGDDLIPGCLLQDTPLCHARGLAVELKSGEIGITLLLQIASFTATFKANRLQLILDRDFDPAMEIPGIEAFAQTCQSYGIAVGVRLPLLGKLLSGEKTPLETWTAVRAAARAFGATHAALDDPCPIGVDPEVCERVVASVARGEVGLANFSLDAKVLQLSGVPAEAIKACGVTGWHRMWENDAPPGPEMANLPLSFDVQAPVLGFTNRGAGDFHRRLDAAMRRLRRTNRRDLLISFRNTGISHMWQNMMYPAATGLIFGWGNPAEGAEAAKRFAGLLYGDAAGMVVDMWETLASAFPPGLDDNDEKLVRRTAFGAWPESEAERKKLQAIDWLAVTRRIKTAADALRAAAADLSRNAVTLSGARLALYALSWLHCFVVLTPELERRRRERYNADARTEPIANELYNNFRAWHAHLQEVHGESGMEFAEMPDVEAMGLRLKGLCEYIFE